MLIWSIAFSGNCLAHDTGTFSDERMVFAHDIGTLSNERMVLRSASEFDYPPFAIVNPNGNPDGFSVDLLKAVVKAMNREVTIKVGPWGEIKQELAAGNLDLLPLVSYSPEREKVYDFTVPYLRMHGTIFVRRGDHSIQSIANLHDKELLVMRGDAAHEYAVKNKLSTKFILTDSFGEAFTMLAEGQGDAVIAQQLMGLQLIKKLGLTNVEPVHVVEETSLKPIGLPLSGFEQKFCIAVKEDDHELLAALNEALAIVFADGTYDRLYEKWFSPILPKQPLPFDLLIRYLLMILVPLLLVLALGGVWYLRKEVRRKTQSLIREIKGRRKVEKDLQKAHDELEQRVLERTEELQKTYKQLLHAEKLSAIGKLSASIAHEFNNPLYGIQSVIEGIKRNAALDESDRQLADLALSECSRVKILIRSLQEFNRPSSGKKELVDVHRLVDDMLVMVKKDFRNAQVDIKKQYADGLPQVEVVTDQIKQVFLNLLTNAKDAMGGRSGMVTIASERLNGKLAFHITDTGEGIRAEHLPHIFEPFFSTKPGVKGTGLGLSVSYGIIKGHGGDIRVDSAPGKGTTFTVVLPLTENNNGQSENTVS